MKDERDLSELIEIIPDAALVVNKDGKIVLVNCLATNMFGYQNILVARCQLSPAVAGIHPKTT